MPEKRWHSLREMIERAVDYPGMFVSLPFCLVGKYITIYSNSIVFSTAIPFQIYSTPLCCKNFVFFLPKIGKHICKSCPISGTSWAPIDWDNGHFAQYRRLQMFKCLSEDRPLNYSGQVSAQFSLNWILGAAAIEYWKKTVIHLIKTWFLFDINWLITLTEYWG